MTFEDVEVVTALIALETTEGFDTATFEEEEDEHRTEQDRETFGALEESLSVDIILYSRLEMDRPMVGSLPPSVVRSGGTSRWNCPGGRGAGWDFADRIVRLCFPLEPGSPQCLI